MRAVTMGGWGFHCPVSSGIRAWVPTPAHLSGRVPTLQGPPALLRAPQQTPGAHVSTHLSAR